MFLCLVSFSIYPKQPEKVNILWTILIRLLDVFVPKGMRTFYIQKLKVINKKMDEWMNVWINWLFGFKQISTCFFTFPPISEIKPKKRNCIYFCNCLFFFCCHCQNDSGKLWKLIPLIIWVTIFVYKCIIYILLLNQIEFVPFCSL